jgi:hypothetical protein
VSLVAMSNVRSGVHDKAEKRPQRCVFGAEAYLAAPVSDLSLQTRF